MKFLISILAASLLLAANVQSAIYLELDGFTGSVTAGGFEGAIECQSASQSATTDQVISPGGGAGKPSIFPIRCTKSIDESSPLFSQKLFTGNSIKDGTLHFVAHCGNGPRALMSIDMQTVYVKGQSASVTAADVPSETISLIFKTITWTSYEQCTNNVVSSYTWDVQ